MDNTILSGRIVGGAVSGAFIGSGAGLVVGALSGAAGYVADISTQHAAKTVVGDAQGWGKAEEFSWEDYLINTAAGIVSAKVMPGIRGRMPTRLSTILTGKHMQRALLESASEEAGTRIGEFFGSWARNTFAPNWQPITLSPVGLLWTELSARRQFVPTDGIHNVSAVPNTPYISKTDTQEISRLVK